MLEHAKRIVIKVGSSLIIGDDGHARKEWLATMAEDILALSHSGKEIIVVTSGAVALGRHALGYGKRSLELEEKQAAAACGQISLISQWALAFQFGGRERMGDWLYPGQILLTGDESIQRQRYLNARNTIEVLLEKGAIPIINENDTVATAEIRFGDNDRLAARVAQMAGADLLILFSDIDGLYSADPNSDPKAEFIREVKDITPDIERMAGGAKTAVSSGGMTTKIEAAKIAMTAGCHMIIARGNIDHPIRALKDGGKATHFVAHGNPRSARKHWIGGSLHPAGSVTIDDGAAAALQSGKSLLPAGVISIEGSFERGEAVLIKNRSNATIGKGLIAYSSEDAKRIQGKRSQDIETILGFKRRDVLIHRDDMVLM